MHKGYRIRKSCVSSATPRPLRPFDAHDSATYGTIVIMATGSGEALSRAWSALYEAHNTTGHPEEFREAIQLAEVTARLALAESIAELAEAMKRGK